MAKYKLTFTTRAIADLQKIIDYYSKMHSGLGARFYLDFKKQVASSIDSE